MFDKKSVEYVNQGSLGHGKSWKKLSWKVMENLLKIESHEILLRAERKFYKLLVTPAIAVT